MAVKNSVRDFAQIGFTLLGVLFGFLIMGFIFGNLGPTQAGLTVGSVAFNLSQATQNNSLAAINTYSANAGTQFTTLSIAITLALLVAVFVFFWKAFQMGGGGRGRSRSYGGGGSFE